MRTNPLTLSSFVAVLLVPMAAAAQYYSPPAAAPPATPWPPPAPAAAPPATPWSAPAPAPMPAPTSEPMPAPTSAPMPFAAPPANFGNVEPAAPVPSEAAEPAPAVTASENDELQRGFIPQLSLGGAVGLLHMSSADVGNVGQLRLGLHGEFFSASNVMVQGQETTAQNQVVSTSDKDTRLQGALTFGITPMQHWEIFGAVLGSANRNRRLCGPDPNTGVEVCTSEPNRTDPELIKTFGDLILGTKLAYPVAAGFSAGGEFGLRMLSSITGLSFSPNSTSVWLNAIGTYDLKPTTQNVPLRFHINIGYYIDNSGNVVDYNASNTSAVSRYVSRFAYGISEDRFRLALGADAPFEELADGFSLRPILEYHFEYLTGSADQVVADSQPANSKNNRDQHWLTLGVQAQVLHGLTMTVGLDVAMKSVGYVYGPALAPWNLLFGVGYQLDLVPRIVTRNVPVEKVVAKEGPMREGLVAGRVISAAGTPVEGAVVGVSGREHSRVLTDTDGTFQSVPLAPGPVELLVVANGFETASVKTEVIAGQTANLVVTLTPRPPAAKAVGRITDDSGKGVVASIKMAGPQIAEAKSDESGNFAVQVASGLYALRVDADQYLSKEVQLSVAEGHENSASITLRSRPAVAGVTFQDGKFKFRQAIAFKAAGKKSGVELATGMPHLLDEVVDILVNRSEIKQVRIEAHWDSSLPAAKAQSLTDEQAKAVAKYLVDQGIAPERVVPVGMAAKKPLVPNLGKGKVKNRRIELVVVN